MTLPRPASLRSGFTLIELLLVLAIIAVLAGMLSSAILMMSKKANSDRISSNAKALQAAIVEYWHDTGEWPIGNNDQPKMQNVGKTQYGKESAGEQSTEKNIYRFSLTYGAGDSKLPNKTVVEKLLNGELPGGGTKRFLDLHGFVTPARPADEGSTDVVDAGVAYEGVAKDAAGNVLSGLKGKPCELVYPTADGKYASYRIFFDFDNNVVEVSTPNVR